MADIESAFNELVVELGKIKDLNNVTESYKEKVTEMGDMIETFLNKSYAIYNESTLKNKEIETKIISASSNAQKETEAKIFSALSNTQKEIETKISKDFKILSKKLRKNQIVNYLKVILLLIITILLFLNNN
ncbi:MAG: hypothetical protein J6E45_03295 [Prevotella sp.]|nr:hypothetical protein [Prevotella sp.]